MSFTQWFTMSCPTVSCFFIITATLSFVPTPSEEETRSVSLVLPWGRRQSPPKEPIPPTTLAVLVAPTMVFTAFSASILLSMFTPAAAYADLLAALAEGTEFIVMFLLCGIVLS